RSLAASALRIEEKSRREQQHDKSEDKARSPKQNLVPVEPWRRVIPLITVFLQDEFNRASKFRRRRNLSLAASCKFCPPLDLGVASDLQRPSLKSRVTT